MKVKSLIMQPWKIGDTIGIAARFQGETHQVSNLFFTPELVKFLRAQFFEIDRRFNVESDEGAFGARIREFMHIRDDLEPPTVGPTSIVKNVRIDERQVPIIFEVENSVGTPFSLEFDEVAVHGLIAELLDSDLAFINTQGQG